MPLRHTSTRWICGLLFALLPQLVLASVARGLVVCEEGDGRTSVEWLAAGCCGPEGDAQTSRGGARALPDDDCASSCSDEALTGPALRTDTHRGEAFCLLVSPFLFPSAELPAPVEVGPALGRRERAPPPSRQLLQLATVVLQL